MGDLRSTFSLYDMFDGYTLPEIRAKIDSLIELYGEDAVGDITYSHDDHICEWSVLYAPRVKA